MLSNLNSTEIREKWIIGFHSKEELLKFQTYFDVYGIEDLETKMVRRSIGPSFSLQIECDQRTCTMMRSVALRNYRAVRTEKV